MLSHQPFLFLNDHFSLRPQYVEYRCGALPAMATAPILQELQRLRELHSTSKVVSSTFQPKEAEQKRLIARVSASKLVNVALKREKAKYIYSEKSRIEGELKRGEHAGDGTGSEGMRPFTTPARASNLSPILYSQKSFHRLRPSTSGHSVVEGKTSGFARVLKSAVSSEDVADELQEQAYQEAKNAKKMFDLISSNTDLGVVCQFSPKRPLQEVDVSHLVSAPALSSSTSSNKLDALTQLRKKDGILIVFDPSTSTEARVITLKIRFMKTVDIGVEELTEKEVSFCSNGNYFGLRLMKEIYRSNSEMSSTLLTGKTSTVRVMLPGWMPCPPVFIPSTAKCSFHWVDINQFIDSASVSNQLSRLRLFCVACPSARAGVKRIHEFLDQQMIKETANLSVPGGISALHYAALHGNMEAVQQLILNGANVNHRCREDKHMTALHEAVMAGQTGIVAYLLQHQASQLLHDDSGMNPLHLACQLGHISIARMLMEHGEGKRALQSLDNNEHKPIDLCANHFLKSCVENVMRKMHIFVKPRVSLYERT